MSLGAVEAVHSSIRVTATMDVAIISLGLPMKVASGTGAVIRSGFLTDLRSSSNQWPRVDDGFLNAWSHYKVDQHHRDIAASMIINRCHREAIIFQTETVVPK